MTGGSEAQQTREARAASAVQHALRYRAERDALAGRVDQLTAALRDFAEHGLRCDLNPTIIPREGQSTYGAMRDYLQRVDQMTRDRAAHALAVLSRDTVHRGVARPMPPRGASAFKSPGPAPVRSTSCPAAVLSAGAAAVSDTTPEGEAMSELTISGHTMLIERLSGRLWECWIHLQDEGDQALCGVRNLNLRPAGMREAHGARGTCPDCLTISRAASSACTPTETT